MWRRHLSACASGEGAASTPFLTESAAVSAYVDLDEPLPIWIRRSRYGWTASLQDFEEADGLGDDRDAALDDLARKVARQHRGEADFDFYARRANMKRAFTSWTWRLRRGPARPVLVEMTMRDLLSRADTAGSAVEPAEEESFELVGAGRSAQAESRLPLHDLVQITRQHVVLAAADVAQSMVREKGLGRVESRAPVSVSERLRLRDPMRKQSGCSDHALWGRRVDRANGV